MRLASIDIFHNRAPTMQASDAHPASTTVLIVDDDESSLDYTSLVLEGLGVLHVKVARNGLQGLQTLDNMRTRPELLICDVFMPEQDGIEFCAELQQRKFDGGLILVSGGDRHMLALARQLAESQGLKVLDALSKPLQAAQLSDLLARC